MPAEMHLKLIAFKALLVVCIPCGTSNNAEYIYIYYSQLGFTPGKVPALCGLVVAGHAVDGIHYYAGTSPGELPKDQPGIRYKSACGADIQLLLILLPLW